MAKGEWSDTALLARVRSEVLPLIESQGPIQVWMIVDTGFPKKGRHSVGWEGNTAVRSANRVTARLP